MDSVSKRVAEAEAENRVPVVLVVEDEVLIRMTIADYLRDCGFRVLEAGDSNEATSLFQAGTSIDVVFSDVNLRGDMSGFVLAQWIRDRHPGTPVILTSGAAKAADAAADVCADGPLMEKPYPPEQVEARIRALLARRDR